MIKKILLYIWQLPQNLIGLVIKLFNKKSLYIFRYKNIKVHYVKHIMDCGISLGHYIFLDRDVRIDYDDILHEHGHQIQSKYLGWFYLIVIGLPSILFNIIGRIFNKSAKWYYNLPWEKWADKLGNVNRVYF